MTSEELRDQLAGRVARLEANVARMQGDVEHLRQLAQTLAPLTAETARLAENVRGLDADMQRVEGKFERRLDELGGLITKRDERSDQKQWALLLTGVTVTISTLGTLILTLVQTSP